MLPAPIATLLIAHACLQAALALLLLPVLLVMTTVLVSCQLYKTSQQIKKSVSGRKIEVLYVLAGITAAVMQFCLNQVSSFFAAAYGKGFCSSAHVAPTLALLCVVLLCTAAMSISPSSCVNPFVKLTLAVAVNLPAKSLTLMLQVKYTLQPAVPQVSKAKAQVRVKADSGIRPSKGKQAAATGEQARKPLTLGYVIWAYVGAYWAIGTWVSQTYFLTPSLTDIYVIMSSFLLHSDQTDTYQCAVVFPFYRDN